MRIIDLVVKATSRKDVSSTMSNDKSGGVIPSVSLDDFSEHVVALHSRHGWKERSSSERMLYLVSEVGELARALIDSGSDSHGDQSLPYDDAAQEMIDIIWNVSALAIGLGVDLNLAARRKLERMNQRDWEGQ
jgi:NTP pyrophosphatase (non-canonical NTP hydrolase)